MNLDNSLTREWIWNFIRCVAYSAMQKYLNMDHKLGCVKDIEKTVTVFSMLNNGKTICLIQCTNV